MRVLVAGGAGFIGQHLVGALADRQAEVVVLDPAPRPARWPAGVEHVAAESLPDDFDLAAIDVMYLLASNSNIPATWDSPEMEVRGNLLPTLEMAQDAARAGVKRLAFASSGGTVYGNFEGSADEDRPARPYTPYGVIKLALEGFLQYLGRRFELGIDIFRIANPYGPGQPVKKGQGVVAHWMQAIRQGDPIRIFGSPRTTRDYIYVEDVARRLTWSLRDPDPGGIWNIGTGVGTSLEELVALLRELSDEAIEVESIDDRGFDAPSNVLDGSRLDAHFPDHPYLPMREGLRRTWDALREGTP